MSRVLAAHTEPVPVQYPAYFNISTGDKPGTAVLIARSRGAAASATVEIPREVLVGLYHALAQALDGKLR
jgi:hypothetical protein